MADREHCTFPPCMNKCGKVNPRPGGPLNLKPTPQSPNCKPCCDPPDWMNHYDLRNIKECDIRSYRQCRLQRWLDHLANRLDNEPFGEFLGRCHDTAEHELKYTSTHLECVGDEFPHFLDRYVWRLWKGANLNLSKHGVHMCENEQQLLLQLLREECDELFQQRAIVPDPSKQMGPQTQWTHFGGGGCHH